MFIELSWKSSKIEGNTYSLLETETLIKQSIEAEGHSKDEATMILNHKYAFENMVSNRDVFMTLDISSDITTAQPNDWGTWCRDWNRNHKVGISGSVYVPIDNQWQLREQLDKLIVYINYSGFCIGKSSDYFSYDCLFTMFCRWK